MIRMRTVRTPRWLLVGLGPLMLVLMLSTDAFPACPSVFNFNFSGSQYTDCFRELLRGSDIIDGTDLGNTGHTALNFTGSTVAGASTWLTVYDATPTVADEGPTFGAETLCADVLIQPYNNAKGAGVVALMNEGAGNKGLGLFISDAGSTDTLILSTVDGDLAQKGKLTTVTSVSLQGGITEKAWYRVVMIVNPAGTPKVTGKVFAHATATDPNSALGPQVGSTLTYSGALPAGVTSPGENGIMASAISSVVNSSVTNFTNDPVACGVSGPPPPPPPTAFPATGQTTCWDFSGTVISCTGTGQDGEIQAGATLSYTDNGDGTVTDNNTGLMWEKKSADGTIHDKDTTYTWANAFAVHIAGLNAGGGFAGHSDWRLPNVKELQSIVNYENFNPSVSSAFNTSCSATCTVLTCSCTAASNYWSSSTSANFPTLAWDVFFNFGLVSAVGKSNSIVVRAVRGGL